MTVMYWASATKAADLDGFHASFRVCPDPPCWVMERGARKLFSTREMAELASHKALIAELNSLGERGKTAPRTSKGIRTFRAEGVGKGAGQVKDIVREADVVFANFGKCD